MSFIDRLRRGTRWLGQSRPLSCRELVELITEYFEGTLSSGDRARFDEHLDRCEGCRIYLEQMRHTIWAMGRLREESIRPPAREALLQAFRTWREG